MNTGRSDWLGAWIDADHNRSVGLDSEGHQPPPPHLCVRAISKVCNCCSPCQAKCKAEVPAVISPPAPDIDFVAAVAALPRIATALEKLVELVGRHTDDEDF